LSFLCRINVISVGDLGLRTRTSVTRLVGCGLVESEQVVEVSRTRMYQVEADDVAVERRRCAAQLRPLSKRVPRADRVVSRPSGI
jgi:hypothetical protein